MVIPSHKNTKVIPSHKNTKVIPSHKNTKVIPSHKNTKVIPSHKNTKVIPSHKNTKVIPSHKNTKVIPSHKNTKVIPSHKNTKVIPSHKNTKVIPSLKDVNNYRPISLLSIFSMSTRSPRTSRNNLPKTIWIQSWLFNNTFINQYNFDLKKAFDTVNHDILLQKLEHYGTRGTSLSWFKSYLSERKQFVHLNGIDSEAKIITCGVPRVCPWSPTFLITYKRSS